MQPLTNKALNASGHGTVNHHRPGMAKRNDALHLCFFCLGTFGLAVIVGTGCRVGRGLLLAPSTSS